eukprot:2517593-Rhodomonas_salina.8
MTAVHLVWRMWFLVTTFLRIRHELSCIDMDCAATRLDPRVPQICAAIALAGINFCIRLRGRFAIADVRTYVLTNIYGPLPSSSSMPGEGLSSGIDLPGIKVTMITTQILGDEK